MSRHWLVKGRIRSPAKVNLEVRCWEFGVGVTNSGDVDAIVPVTGTREWLSQLPLKIKSEWRPWYVNSQVCKCPRLSLWNLICHQQCLVPHCFVFNYIGPNFINLVDRVDDVGFIKIGQIERRFRICGITFNHMGPNFMHLVNRPDNVGFIICGVNFNHVLPNSIHLVDRLGIVGFIKLGQIESRFRSCGVVFNRTSPNFIHLVDRIDAVGFVKMGWIDWRFRIAQTKKS